MKKTTLAVLVGMALVPAAVANQVRVGYPGSAYGVYQTGVGGEFTLNPLTGWLDLSGYADETKNIGPVGTFQTFCVEGTEFISGYSATYTAVLNQNAIRGSVGSGGDPISVGTGWLYSQFATANWDAGLSYNYWSTTALRKISADFLQKAIWWLEGEEGIAYNHSNPYMAAVAAKFGQDGAKGDGGWNYGVYALNLTSTSGVLAQDQLVYIPVPDGGLTLVLLGLGLGGVGMVSRKLRK